MLNMVGAIEESAMRTLFGRLQNTYSANGQIDASVYTVLDHAAYAPQMVANDSRVILYLDFIKFVGAVFTETIYVRSLFRLARS